MKYLKSAPVIFALAFTASTALAQVKAYDLTFHLSLREKFYTSFLETQKDVNNLEKIEALKLWKELKGKEISKFNYFLTNSLKAVVNSQSVIDWFAHYQMTGQTKKSAEILSSYYYSVAAFIWETAQNPRFSDGETAKQQLQSSATTAFQAAQQIEACLAKTTVSAGKDLNSLTALVNTCVNANSQVLVGVAQKIMNTRKYLGPNQVVSLSGFIPGNKVEQLTQNFYSADFIRYLAPMTSTVQKNYANVTVEAFKQKMISKSAALTDFFTTAEGFPATPREHKNWNLVKSNGKKNIYGAVFSAIENAKESVFIDVFFLGGSIGTSLAKHLIEQVQKKPSLKVFILNDRANPLSYDKEMAPVYNYLRAYAEKFPEDRLIIMTPRIDLKRTAFPAIAENIINDQTLKFVLNAASQAELKDHLNFYPKGKSDHSKVIVIDGKSKTLGLAFVGSKNYTDSSGAVAYDEVTQIQGPAVPVILDSYYYDLTEALAELKVTSPNYFGALASKNNLSGSSDVRTSVRQLLSSLDVLNRATPSAKADLQWPVTGSAVLSIGENNVYGTIRSALSQDIALINSAEKQIIISDQFLYDPLIIRALLEKIQKSQGLKVYIMLATMEDELDPTKKFAHVPNISYIESLKATGQVFAKWKKVPDADIAALKEVNTKYLVRLAPEYHLKAISIDGISVSESGLCQDPQKNAQALSASMSKIPGMISGSANKDVLSLSGGFREFQVAVYDRSATVAHDCEFWMRFNDPDQSKEITYTTMNLPQELVNAGIDSQLFNQIVRNIINLSYGAITGYFNN